MIFEVFESYAEYSKVKGWKQENEMIEWHRVRFGRPAGTNGFVSFYVRVTILILLKKKEWTYTAVAMFSIFLLSSFLRADMPLFSIYIGNFIVPEIRKSSHIVLSRLGLLNLSTFGRSHAKMHFRANVLTDLLTFATTTTTTTTTTSLWMGGYFVGWWWWVVEWKL